MVSLVASPNKFRIPVLVNCGRPVGFFLSGVIWFGFVSFGRKCYWNRNVVILSKALLVRSRTKKRKITRIKSFNSNNSLSRTKIYTLLSYLWSSKANIEGRELDSFDQSFLQGGFPIPDSTRRWLAPVSVDAKFQTADEHAKWWMIDENKHYFGEPFPTFLSYFFSWYFT